MWDWIALIFLSLTLGATLEYCYLKHECFCPNTLDKLRRRWRASTSSTASTTTAIINTGPMAISEVNNQAFLTPNV